jgi:hypothetical protein
MRYALTVQSVDCMGYEDHLFHDQSLFPRVGQHQRGLRVRKGRVRAVIGRVWRQAAVQV